MNLIIFIVLTIFFYEIIGGKVTYYTFTPHYKRVNLNMFLNVAKYYIDGEGCA